MSFVGRQRHTDLERRVLGLAVELARAFARLQRDEGEVHSSHGDDVARAVHDVQRVVAIRLAKRADPEAWE